jgi:two-component system cell cycle sensor histidine kinase/response regulator CckA
MSARLFQLAGELCILSITRHISDRKKAEEEKSRLETQLFHAQKMESAGRLAGGVANDINNILSVVMGYVELMIIPYLCLTSRPGENRKIRPYFSPLSACISFS